MSIHRRWRQMSSIHHNTLISILYTTHTMFPMLMSPCRLPHAFVVVTEFICFIQSCAGDVSFQLIDGVVRGTGAMIT